VTLSSSILTVVTVGSCTLPLYSYLATGLLIFRRVHFEECTVELSLTSVITAYALLLIGKTVQ
jgi:hypothetical protein